MSDETAVKMYESGRERLLVLLKQEKEVKEQISHWVPIVNQLAQLCGETVDPEIMDRVNQLNANQLNVNQTAGEMGLTEAIRWVFRQPLMLPLTPTQVRDHLAQMGYDLGKYAHVMPPIHNTLKRMKEAGEIREVDNLGGLGKAFVAGSSS